MSDLFSYLRWRIITGLITLIFGAVILSMTGVGSKLRYTQVTEEESAQARQLREQYQAESEIRRARQTGGYDPSDPAYVRDGYDSQYSSSGTEPYGTNPSE